MSQAVDNIIRNTYGSPFELPSLCLTNDLIFENLVRRMFVDALDHSSDGFVLVVAVIDDFSLCLDLEAVFFTEIVDTDEADEVSLVVEESQHVVERMIRGWAAVLQRRNDRSRARKRFEDLLQGLDELLGATVERFVLAEPVVPDGAGEFAACFLVSLCRGPRSEEGLEGHFVYHSEGPCWLVTQ